LDFNKDYEASVFETTIRLCYKVYVVELSCLGCILFLSLNTFSHLSLLSVRAREGRVSEGRSLLVAGIEYGEGSKLVCGI
jgi:hypothetical protein